MVHDFDPVIVATPLGAIHWYGAVYSVGFVGVYAWLRLRHRAIGLSPAEATALTIAFAAGVLAGGRLFDILVYEMDFYRDRPLAALNIWNGGMASHGVLIGGLAATWAFARWRRIPLLVLLDEIVIPAALLLAVGRIGNFIEGGVIGSPTGLPWGVVYENVPGPRHPVALYESAKNLLLIPVLVWAIRIWPPGRGIAASLFVLLYALLRFAVDLLRDYEAAWLGIGTGQVYNLAMAAIGAAMLGVFLRRRHRPLPPPRPAAERRPGWLATALLWALILYPLGIPTSWTQENIVSKREASDQERN